MNPAALSYELSEIIKQRRLNCLPLSKKEDEAMADRLASLAIAAESDHPGSWNQCSADLSLIHSFVLDPLALSALLASGLDPQAIGPSDRQPIHSWALAVISWSQNAESDNHRGHKIKQALTILLDAGVDIDALDFDGSTPLAILASSPTSFLSDLLLAGADCSRPIRRKKYNPSEDAQTPSILPIWAVIAQTLLTFRPVKGQPRISSRIASFDCRRSRKQWQLAIDCLRSQPSIDWALHGQSPFAEAFESARILSKSVPYSNPDFSWADDLRSMGSWIASQGASPSSCDFDGWPVLATAAANGDIASVSGLLSLGASTESSGPQGFTPLMAAAFNGRTEIVSMLLAAGSRLDATDNDGKSALDLAIAYGGPQCSMALEILELEALIPAPPTAPKRRFSL